MSTLTPLEERLTAALAARAEQVHPHHLRDAPAPTPERGAEVVPLRRRRVAIALAAAAACAAVAAGVVWSDLGEDGQDVPQPAPSPTVPAEVPDDVGADWGVVDRTRLDLDGDGTPEELRLRDSSAGTEGLPDNPARVDAVLSSTGQLAYGTFDNNGTFTNFFSPATIDADSDGSDEVVVYRPDAEGVGGGDLLVVDLVGGYLVEVPREESAPLSVDAITDESKPQRRGEFFAFATNRWVQDGTLYSSRSVESYATGGVATYFNVPRTYRSLAWAWRIEEGRLVPEPVPEVCIDALEDGGGTPAGRACADGETDAVPGFFPERPATVGVGQSAAFDDVDFDQRPDTLGIEGPGGDVEEGEAELVLDLSAAGEQRVPLPAGGTPVLYPRTIQVGMLDGVSLLVQQESGDGTQMSYLATGAAGFAEPPTVRPTRGAPFGSGVRADGTAWRTWVGPDDALYTRVGTVDDDADTPVVVFTWRFDGEALVASPLGTFCVDDAAGTARRC
ncbi:hypothetical protein [Nocardioides nanhaiensis]|uniref:VCBS repeat-containing protein n=1 Tax=Nocardioides nanhaiensis TaxID=1476871 RepID=A0ABP8WG71_9ACTN